MNPVSYLAITDAQRNAEAGVIGACLIYPRLLRDLDLEIADFVHLPHRCVFTALRNLEAETKPIDVLSVELQLEREGNLDAAGGMAALGLLALAPPIPQNVEEYARAVRDGAVKRRVLLAASDLIETAKASQITGEELLAEAGVKFGAIDGAKAEHVFTIGELAQRRLTDVERLANEQADGKKAITGVPTGVKGLDAKLGGWQYGIVNLIAARPGMGKSALALATADAASEAGIGVHVFSLEDSWHAYTDRAIARRSGVPAVNLRRAELSGDQIGRVVGATALLRRREGWRMDDRSGLTANEIVRSARRNQERNGTRCVVVDYIQLVRRRDPRLSEYEALGESMATFAEAAKADDQVYLVLSQLNRKLEDRPDKRPVMSDLRGSGELEEKCKVAVGLYRGAYYGEPKRGTDYDCKCERSTECTHRPSGDAWESMAELIVMKGGNGPTGVVEATWNGKTVEIS